MGYPDFKAYLDAINEVLRDEGLRDWGKSVV